MNVSVCFLHEELGESTTELNADTVCAFKRQMIVYGIPYENLIGVLADSCAFMRGCHNGFQQKLKSEICPHLIDVDGDACHHMHNIVKKFSDELDLDNVFAYKKFCQSKVAPLSMYRFFYP